MSFRNRCVVAGSNGLVNLSVPLVGGRSQKQLVRDVRISHSDNWGMQHWRTIESCYNRSPFFEYYRDWLQDFFSRKQEFLVDLNLEVLHWLQTQLKLEATLMATQGPVKDIPPGTLDLRGHFAPKHFQEPIPGSVPILYTQVFADRIGFQPNLSILDMLFCCGPGSRELLLKYPVTVK